MSLTYSIGAGFDAGTIGLHFDSSSFATPPVNGLRLRNGNASNAPQTFYYGGSGTSIPSSTWNPVVGDAYLLMARFTIDYDVNGNDRVQVWTHPGDVSTIGALGTADFLGEGSDVFGAAFNSIGFMVPGASRLDSIRISNESDGFTFVTTGVAIPEPGSLVLFGLAGLSILLFRRRS